ncbi:MAG: hypothetical protein U0X73_08165 [Thermoanaerobaculia bacterium]
MNQFQSDGGEQDALRRALQGLESDLPKGWQWGFEEESPKTRRGFDALATIEAPDGQRATLVVEARRLVASRDVLHLVAQVRANASRAGLRDAVPLVVARYLPPETRARLEKEGVAYADATGNRRLALERPALFLRNVGADRDPWRGPGRPRGTLRGGPAARVVRWLVDFTPPYTVAKIAEGSGVSLGATYRVVKFLEEEEIVERQPQEPVRTVRWRQLLERWSRDFGFQKKEPATSLLFPRGLEALLEALRGATDLQYVVTGSLAARRYAPPYAPARFAMIYADDLDRVVETLGLRAVDTGANVLVATDREGVASERAKVLDGVRYAAPSQVAVDLLTGPGRSPSEAEALLDWMEAHEREWRS